MPVVAKARLDSAFGKPVRQKGELDPCPPPPPHFLCVVPGVVSPTRGGVSGVNQRVVVGDGGKEHGINNIHPAPPYTSSRHARRRSAPLISGVGVSTQNRPAAPLQATKQPREAKDCQSLLEPGSILPGPHTARRSSAQAHTQPGEQVSLGGEAKTPIG